MVETLAVINGMEIYRHIGERGCYWVARADRGRTGYRFWTFRTMKAAKAFCENL